MLRSYPSTLVNNEHYLHGQNSIRATLTRPTHVSLLTLFTWTDF